MRAVLVVVNLDVQHGREVPGFQLHYVFKIDRLLEGVAGGVEEVICPPDDPRVAGFIPVAAERCILAGDALCRLDKGERNFDIIDFHLLYRAPVYISLEFGNIDAMHGIIDGNIDAEFFVADEICGRLLPQEPPYAGDCGQRQQYNDQEKRAEALPVLFSQCLGDSVGCP